MRYFFHIAYHGTRYNGWQKLPHNKSIQSVIEVALSQIIKKPVSVVGCGRTDSHVHASQYFFHCDSEPINTAEVKFRLNKTLPNDIAIFDILPVEDHQHARLSALERTYTYFIHREKDPFLNNISSLYQHEFDIERIKAGISMLPKYNDYRFFHRPASRPKTTLCHVNSTELFIGHNGDRLKLTITANRFLSGMVRIIVHKLLMVGKGKLTLDEFENYLKGDEAPSDIKSAYPQGLYLTKVKYPFLDLPSQSKFDLLTDNQSFWQRV